MTQAASPLASCSVAGQSADWLSDLAGLSERSERRWHFRLIAKNH